MQPDCRQHLLQQYRFHFFDPIIAQFLTVPNRISPLHAEQSLDNICPQISEFWGQRDIQLLRDFLMAIHYAIHHDIKNRRFVTEPLSFQGYQADLTSYFHNRFQQL